MGLYRHAELGSRGERDRYDELTVWVGDSLKTLQTGVVIAQVAADDLGQKGGIQGAGFLHGFQVRPVLGAVEKGFEHRQTLTADKGGLDASKVLLVDNVTRA